MRDVDAFPIVLAFLLIAGVGLLIATMPALPAHTCQDLSFKRDCLIHNPGRLSTCEAACAALSK